MRFEETEQHFLSWSLHDNREDKFVRATILNDSFNQVTQYTLSHSTHGSYHSNIAPLLKGRYLVIFKVYDDAAFTKVNHRYSSGMIYLRIEDIETKLASLGGQITDNNIKLDTIKNTIIETIDDGDGIAV